MFSSVEFEATVNTFMNLKNEQQEDSSTFLHHRRKMLQLDWETEPQSVALFIQDFASVNSDLLEKIQLLKQFLNDLHIRIDEEKYDNDDFIILIGTDGHNLHVSSLFQDRDTPPILSFTPSTMGFVSFIELAEYEKIIPQILRGNAWLLPRCRLLIEYHSLEGLERFVVLNDIVINRDHMSGSLVITCTSCGLTFSQLIGDGAIIATPTGSTAYNKGAGGALVHPLLPVFMLTPICALSLSARPILFPQSADLTIELDVSNPRRQKQGASLTFDGKGHRPFKPGEKLVISVSQYYFNSIMMTKSIAEWPVRLAGLMGWNDRKHQKPLAPQGAMKK